MHVLSAASLVALMLAFVPVGLTGMGVALSLSSIAVAAYALRGAGRVVGIPVRRLLEEIWPPAAGAILMAGILYAVEHGVVHADAHGVVLGLTLLVAEAAGGAVLFLAFLAALRPDRAAELRELIGVAVSRRQAGPQPLPRG
jgi:hypothetical protein